MAWVARIRDAGSVAGVACRRTAVAALAAIVWCTVALILSMSGTT
jgi:hypothetical protein